MTTDELVFDGKKYVSVKRASELTGYTRDYVGQLARGGKVEARRMGRAWFVDEISLLAHKADADLFVPTPPPSVEGDVRPVESFVHLDGNEYISARRASELLGYNPDYVSQMARDGKVKSTQLGSRWFVAKKGIEEHKARTDAALAAFQAESSGLLRPEAPPLHQSPNVQVATPSLYFPDEKPLFPEIQPRAATKEAFTHPTAAASAALYAHEPILKVHEPARHPVVVRKAQLPMPTVGLLPMVVGGLLLVLSIGLPTLYAFYGSNPAVASAAVGAGERFAKLAELVPESFLSSTLTFGRDKSQ